MSKLALSASFSINISPLHLNTYVVGLRHYKYVLPYIAEIDFRRQNLTFTDVRF